jgi:hypothetical protein
MMGNKKEFDEESKRPKVPDSFLDLPLSSRSF